MRGSDQSVLARDKILLDHKGDLEDDRVIKLAQVKAGKLLDLLKTVYQRISVDEQLAGRFGDVQIVLKELIDREQRLLIERVIEFFLNTSDRNISQSVVGS